MPSLEFIRDFRKLQQQRQKISGQALWVAITGAIQLNGYTNDVTQGVFIMLVSVLKTNKGLSEDEAIAKIQAKLRGDA